MPNSLAQQRVLVLHNRYRVPGGEERFAAGLTELLSRHAESAQLLEASSESLSRAGAGVALVRGGLDVENVTDAVRSSGATIVHAHNIHPAYGWRALKAAREAGAAVVLHLHNYRLFCAIGTVFRDGADCTDCAPRRTWNGLLHNCRGSVAEAGAYAIGLARSQQPLIENVDRFVAPVAQLAGDLGELGFDLPIDVVPSWLAASEFATQSSARDGEYALYIGRLTVDKGLLVAIRAAAISGVPLRVAGVGPDYERARKLVESEGAPVEFLGMISGQAIVAARMGAAFALVPSLWREVLPLSALESLAAGVPLLTSDRGGLPELTEPDLVTPAGDAEALARAMRALFDDPDRRQVAGAAALARANERFTESAFVERIGQTYAAASAARQVLV